MSAEYLDYDGLKEYDELIYDCLTKGDQEALKQSAISIDEITPTTDGSIKTYGVYQGVNENEEKILIKKIEIAAATPSQGSKADTAVQSVKIGNTEYKVGVNVVLPEYPTTLPASDVHDWAKEENKPTYTADEVGALPNTTVIPTQETVDIDFTTEW